MKNEDDPTGSGGEGNCEEDKMTAKLETFVLFLPFNTLPISSNVISILSYSSINKFNTPAENSKN